MSARFASGTRMVPAGAEPLTVCDRLVDVAVYPGSPEYFAVMECVPAGSDALEHVARPAIIGTTAQMAVAPSLKVTVPVGARTPPVTVAVNVMAWPPFAGLSEDVSPMVGATGAGGTDGNSR